MIHTCRLLCHLRTTRQDTRMHHIITPFTFPWCRCGFSPQDIFDFLGLTYREPAFRYSFLGCFFFVTLEASPLKQEYSNWSFGIMVGMS